MAIKKSDIEYKIASLSPEAHLFEIELTLAKPDPNGQVFMLPAWIPGSYMIRDFAKHLVTINAYSAGNKVCLTKQDKQTWQAAPVTGALTLVYQIYAWDLSVRGAHLDTTHGFFNGTSVFLRVLGQEAKKVSVAITTPAGDAYDNWQIATTLPAIAPHQYQADNYDHLLDCPVEMGTYQTLKFTVADIPHSMAVTGRVAFDQQRLAADLQKICRQHATMFGALPVEQYLFLTMAVSDGYGGLEHRDSTSLICQKNSLPKTGATKVSDAYQNFLGLCSHEYFHLWNIKRIRPEVLKKADLSCEVHTQLLWAFEGITSYYDDLGVVRAGCIEVSSYLPLLAKNITRVMRGSGRLKQSVASSSFDAWTKFYKQDENAPNAIVSYYAKGAMVAFGLDIALRDATDDKLTLDDLMRRLWQDYGSQDLGVPEAGIEQLAAELSNNKLEDFFAQAVHGTQDLPIEDWFKSVGVGYRLRPATDPKDQGGSKKPDEIIQPKPELGARYVQQGDLVKLTHVLDEGAAQQTGLSAGDKLVAINGLQVTADGLADMLTTDESLEVLAFRRDELMTFTLQPALSANDTCDLWLLPAAECSKQQLTRRASWLGQTLV